MVPYRQCKEDGSFAEKFYPSYDDAYLDYWQNLLELLGERFDNDPLVEFTDISGYGRYGEWQHGKWSPFENDTEAFRVGKRLVDDHLKAFSKTPAVMVINIDRCEHGPLEKTIPYANEKGCWRRRNYTLGPFLSSWDFRFHRQGRTPGTAFILEQGFFPELVDPTIQRPIYAIDQYLQIALDYEANFLSLGFNPWHAKYLHDINYNSLEYAAQKLGYRIRPAVVWFGEKLDSSTNYISVGLVNDGVAQVPGIIKINLYDNDALLARSTLEPGQPFAGTMVYPELDLPQSYDYKGKDVELRLSVLMRGKEYPVKWAVKSTQLSKDNFTLKIRLPMHM